MAVASLLFIALLNAQKRKQLQTSRPIHGDIRNYVPPKSSGESGLPEPRKADHFGKKFPAHRPLLANAAMSSKGVCNTALKRNQEGKQSRSGRFAFEPITNGETSMPFRQISTAG
jgi:hypothetical protein